MRIHNLYTDASGQSHFRDIEVEWVEEGSAGKLSKRLPATGIIFRQVQPDYDLDWHPAPRRQYIINLDAGVQITAGDGEARIIGAGEVVLVEDTTGKGHLSKAVEGKIRHCIVVPVELAGGSGEGKKRRAIRHSPVVFGGLRFSREGRSIPARNGIAVPQIG